VELTRPAWLWGLAALPILAGLVVRARKWRRHAWGRLGKSIFPRGEPVWRWLIVLGLLLAAAAGPRWNWRSQTGATMGHDVVLVVDTSRSMGVTDALPNRMGTAITSAESLIRALGAKEGGRVGVVAFAGRAVVRCPLTHNLGVAADALKALRPGTVQPGGTNIAAGVGLALHLLEKPSRDVPRTIVLFTDGEDHIGTWPALVSRLREGKVTLHGVAIGDDETGHPVPMIGGKPLRFDGKIVESRRNDTPIETLAASTGGSVARLGLAPADLAVLFDRGIKPLATRRRLELQRAATRSDQHVPFVLLALVVGVSACRPRRVRSTWVVWPLLFVLAGASPVDRATSMWIREGKAAYDRKDWNTAREFFDRALRESPNSAVACYNAAATAFQAGRYPEALKLYQRSRALTSDAGLRMKIAYALGNTQVALGQRSRAVEAYAACIASNVPGPEYDAIRRDAAINKQFAEKNPPKPSESEQDGGKGRDSQSGKDSDESKGEERKAEKSENSGSSNNAPPSASDAAAGAVEALEQASARDRFQQALETIRQARDFRSPEAGNTSRQGEVLKDW